MLRDWKSLLGGTAVAAFLILPATASSDWVTWPQKSFNSQDLHVEDIVGSVTVGVKPGPVTVRVGGTKDAVQNLTVEDEDGTVAITGHSNHISVWDWHNWFNFNNLNDNSDSRLQLHITVPKGAQVRVGGLIGDANIGDTQGPLRFDAVDTRSHIGRVADAHISLAGSGKVDVTQIAGELHLDIAGSGRVNVGNTGSVKASLAGSGDAILGAVNGGINLDVAGSGNLTATRVNGPVHIDIAGAGSVKIAGGTADPLHVDILGSGDLYFGGVAVDPHISALGSGSVHLKSYRGQLHSDGMASVHIGD